MAIENLSAARDREPSHAFHAAHRLGHVFGSDGMPGAKKPESTDTHVLLELDDGEDATKKWQVLAANGTVLVPFEKAFWGGRYGVVTDAFGTHWMIQAG
jgi:PhnB protein